MHIWRRRRGASVPLRPGAWGLIPTASCCPTSLGPCTRAVPPQLGPGGRTSQPGSSLDLLPNRSWGWHLSLGTSSAWPAGNCPQGPGGTILSSSFTAYISLNSLLSRQPVAQQTMSLTHQIRAPKFKAERSPSPRRCSHICPATARFLSIRHHPDV